MKYIYCDESCHLEFDSFDTMVLGGISCPKDKKKQIFNDIRTIKEKHGVSSWTEIKWTKVSNNKINLYLDLVDYFFKNEDLNFRGVVARNKKSLDHSQYNVGGHDEWYYKMYFILLDKMIYPSDHYRIFLDIKDTRGGAKTRKLHKVLCNNQYDFTREVIDRIDQINSKESEIIQLTDLFIGALSYYHRNMHKIDGSSLAKKKILTKLEKNHNITLNSSTKLNEDKFNIFVWYPRS